MTGDEVVAYLDDLGRDIVPAVREIEPVARVVRGYHPHPARTVGDGGRRARFRAVRRRNV